MLLNSQEIKQCQTDNGLFNPYCKESVQGASYDLHIGDKVYISSSVNGSKGVLTLKTNDVFIIPANGIFMVQTREKVVLPNNIAGKLSLRMGLVRKGLIMPSQTQADPGYNNHLFGFLYNLSNEDIKLSFGDHVFSIELFKLSEDTEKPYCESYDSMKFEEFVSNYIHSSLDFLNQKITKSQVELKSSTNYIKILSFIYSVAGLVLGGIIGYITIGPFNQLKDDFEEIKAEKIELETEYKKLENKFNMLDKNFAIHETKSFNSVHVIDTIK